MKIVLIALGVLAFAQGLVVEDGTDGNSLKVEFDYEEVEWLYTSSFLSVMSGDKSELLLSRNIST